MDPIQQRIGFRFVRVGGGDIGPNMHVSTFYRDVMILQPVAILYASEHNEIRDRTTLKVCEELADLTAGLA